MNKNNKKYIGSPKKSTTSRKTKYDMEPYIKLSSLVKICDKPKSLQKTKTPCRNTNRKDENYYNAPSPYYLRSQNKNTKNDYKNQIKNIEVKNSKKEKINLFSLFENCNLIGKKTKRDFFAAEKEKLTSKKNIENKNKNKNKNKK